MLKYLVLIFSSLFGASLTAQPGWNWPEDPKQHDLTKEKQAYYKVQMHLDEYPDAWKTLQLLYKIAPDLNASIYIDGAKVIEEILKGTLDKTRNAALEDSLLWTYDMRIKYFDERAAATDRKAYTAFKLYYKKPAKYPELLSLYKDLFNLQPDQISDFNLTPYMTLAVYYHKHMPEELTAEDVLDIHGVITGTIDQKRASGQDQAKLKKEQDKVDAFLNTLGDDILSCEFIEINLLPKFNDNPQDLNLAKKVFSYSLKARCSEKPYFTRAGETLFAAEPSYSLAKALADRYYASEDYNKALEYFRRASTLAKSGDQKFDALMGRASVRNKLGEKSLARAQAYEALSIKPNSPDAFTLIGNLYYTSYDECKGGTSRVRDRAVFIAAYEMYQKAGNEGQMEAAKAQFPSIEEIFNENMEEGQTINVDCWINQSVTIRRR